MSTSLPAPLFIADHPVLDLLNTVRQVDGAPQETLDGDAGAKRWLERAGMLRADAGPPPAGLLKSTVALREAVRDLVLHRKAEAPADPSALNAYLAQASGFPQLVWPPHGTPRLDRVQRHRTAVQWLAPLAEAAAQLLVEGDFGLVRQCEHDDCTLWFYDRTKSHRRRWCSMSVCGNRHKVSAFRQRSAAAG